MPVVGAIVLTAGMVAEATGGSLVTGAATRVFDTVSTDSRTMTPGALFIALAGPRFDGHAFAADAIARGAGGVLVSAVPASTSTIDAAVIVVPDTLAALQRLAREVRRQSGARVIAITGSTGKTSTKEITADLLATRFDVFRNRGNLNNHIGLPLSLLELRAGPDIAVVEFGMNHVGEIRTLVEIAEPDVRVWTNVGDAHIGNFGSRDRIAEAKAEILEHATPSTLVVGNADDPWVMKYVNTCRGRRLTFGETAGADVRATHVIDRGFDGTEADVTTPRGPLHLRVPLAGRAQLANVLAATTVALDCGVAPSAIEARVAALVPVARRGEIVTAADGVRLVDDSYNASPDAVRRALDTLRSTGTSGRRIAVLGEMLELGDAARALHEACGRAAVAAGVDVLVAIGAAPADGFIDGARAAGMPSARMYRCADSTEAAALVARIVQHGDLVLVKGSRGTRTDIVVDRLKEVG
jgi:UDP-N-acetylmuramoyl-tripeptide--D-alanyl-D-alanine ligase